MLLSLWTFFSFTAIVARHTRCLLCVKFSSLMRIAHPKILCVPEIVCQINHDWMKHTVTRMQTAFSICVLFDQFSPIIWPFSVSGVTLSRFSLQCRNFRANTWTNTQRHFYTLFLRDRIKYPNHFAEFLPIIKIHRDCRHECETIHSLAALCGDTSCCLLFVCITFGYQSADEKFKSHWRNEKNETTNTRDENEPMMSIQVIVCNR